MSVHTHIYIYIHLSLSGKSSVKPSIWSCWHIVHAYAFVMCNGTRRLASYCLCPRPFGKMPCGVAKPSQCISMHTASATVAFSWCLLGTKGLVPGLPCVVAWSCRSLRGTATKVPAEGGETHCEETPARRHKAMGITSIRNVLGCYAWSHSPYMAS